MGSSVWCGVLGYVLWLVGCGGDGSGSTCGNSAGCGGDVVGTWKITSSCVEVDIAQTMGSMSCPGITGGGSKVNMTGSITYEAGGTFQSNVTLSGSVTATVPASCLTQQGTTYTCAQLQQALKSSDFSSISCTGSSDCSCVLQLAPQEEVSSGTYTTSGDTLIQSDAGDSPSSNTYCVKGSTLTLSPDADSGTTGTVTLTKQ